jgi:hypothetical protein
MTAVSSRIHAVCIMRGGSSITRNRSHERVLLKPSRTRSSEQRPVGSYARTQFNERAGSELRGVEGQGNKRTPAQQRLSAEEDQMQTLGRAGQRERERLPPCIHAHVPATLATAIAISATKIAVVGETKGKVDVARLAVAQFHALDY